MKCINLLTTSVRSDALNTRLLCEKLIEMGPVYRLCSLQRFMVRNLVQNARIAVSENVRQTFGPYFNTRQSVCLSHLLRINRGQVFRAIPSPLSKWLVHIRWALTQKLIYLFTYSLEQIPSWEANRFSASQEIPRFLRIPNAHYRNRKCTPTVPILSNINPVYGPPPIARPEDPS
jgi:hypothetical protein